MTDGGGDNENVAEQNYSNLQQKCKMLLLSHGSSSDSSIFRETFPSMKSLMKSPQLAKMIILIGSMVPFKLSGLITIGQTRCQKGMR